MVRHDLRPDLHLGFVAILGIVNTLTVSIADRRRELGVLRAVGGLRHQIRGTIWLEALAVGAIGLILGLTLGAVNLYYQLECWRAAWSECPSATSSRTAWRPG